jgi:hypothetical protein
MGKEMCEERSVNLLGDMGTKAQLMGLRGPAWEGHDALVGWLAMQGHACPHVEEPILLEQRSTRQQKWNWSVGERGPKSSKLGCSSPVLVFKTGTTSLSLPDIEFG